MEKEISMDEANGMQEALNNANNFYIAKSYLIDISVIASAFGINPDSLTDYSGLRIYFGLKYHGAVDQAANDDGTKTLEPMVVAVDNKEEDIIGSVPSNTSNGSHIFGQVLRCPPKCNSSVNELSSNSEISICTK
jgi:hypothetical protein